MVGLAIGAVLLGISAGGCSKQTTDRDIQPISLTEVRALLDSPRAGSTLLIDPRPPSVFAAGHIPGARNMQLSEVRQEAGVNPTLDRYGQLVVYGDDPGTGSAVAMTKRLMMTGYKNVRMFMGGMSEWRRAGLPVESGATQ